MDRKNVIRIHLQSAFAPYLALRASADRLFDSIEDSAKKEFLVDFSGVESMTRSFAHQYMLRKKQCPKKVSEANMVENVQMVMVMSAKPVQMATVSAKTMKVMKLML
jgi:hypothetical protein